MRSERKVSAGFGVNIQIYVIGLANVTNRDFNSLRDAYAVIRAVDLPIFLKIDLLAMLDPMLSLQEGNAERDSNPDSCRHGAEDVTREGRTLCFFQIFGCKEALHEEGEMLAWDSAALGGLGNDTAGLRKLRAQVRLCEFLDNPFLCLRIGQVGQGLIVSSHPVGVSLR